MLTAATWLLAGVAFSAPPSTNLSGPDGTLSWQVAESGGNVSIVGTSPKWKVEHTADSALRPIKTKRTDPDGSVTTVVWEGDRVTVTLPNGKQVVHEEAGIWDGDSLDIRLGERVRTGASLDHSFKAVDSGSGKVYRFDAVDKGQATCAAGPCRHVNVTLGGWMKYVGPNFDMWFAANGQLVKFSGGAGDFGA